MGTSGMMSARHDPHYVRGLWRGRECGVILQASYHVVVNADRTGEILAPVDDAVPDRLDLTHVFDHAVFLVDQGVEHDLYGFDMVFHVFSDDDFILPSGNVQQGNR